MHHLSAFLNHVLFLSCFLKITDPCCSFLFGGLVYLRKSSLYFEGLYLHQKPRRFWHYSFGLNSKNYQSLLSPGLQEGVFRIILFASELVPWALVWCPTFRLAFLKLFSFHLFFSKRRNKCLICHWNTLWWFLSTLWTTLHIIKYFLYGQRALPFENVIKPT